MARINNNLLKGQAFDVAGNTNAMLDMTFGGQMGYAPNLTEWVSNQAYIRRNLVPIVLEAPRFFQLMPNPQKWVDSFKSLIEKHCYAIEGYNAGLEVSFDEHAVGGGGEMHQEITDVKRARSEPSFTFIEKYGRPIQNFLEFWIRYGMMDPETKFALMGTIASPQGGVQDTLASGHPSDALADWFTGTILVFEPDPTHRRVEKAWITANFAPKGTGEIVGRRDLKAASELTTLTIGFTGISQYGLGVKTMAQQILDNLNLASANPFNRPAFVQSVSSTVSASQEGYIKGITDLAASAVSGI